MKGFVNLTHTNNKKINDVANRVSTIENTYAKKDDISNVYKYKGSVQNYSDLPTVNNAVGDTYNVVNAYLNYPAGTNFAWDGTKFDALGGSIDFSKMELTAENLSNVLQDSETIVSMIDNNKVEFQLSADITNKLQRTLMTPMTTPTQTELVGIDDTSSQTRIEIGEGLSLVGDVLSVTGSNLEAHKHLILGANGVLEGNVYNFTVENADDFLIYRTNLTKFLVDLNLSIVGDLDLTKEVAITFGDTVYYVFNILKGNEHATIQDLHQVDKYSNETGYRFITEMTFFETSDSVGFAIIPTISMSDILSLDSDQMDNYMADGGLTNGQLAVCKKVINNGYVEGGLYRFEIQYPDIYSWVRVDNFVKDSDYATSNKAGLVRMWESGGIGINNVNGNIYLSPATKTIIDNRSIARSPITVENFEYAVKVGLTANEETLTEEEKTKAQEWLGITELVGDIETLLENLDTGSGV